MGLEVKQNKEGLYKLTSTVSDESHHPDKEWVTVEEAKKVLMARELWNFIEKIIEVDACFPGSYRVNDKYDVNDDSKSKHLRWLIDNAYGENGDEKLEAKFKEVTEKLGLKINIEWDE